MGSPQKINDKGGIVVEVKSPITREVVRLFQDLDDADRKRVLRIIRAMRDGQLTLT